MALLCTSAFAGGPAFVAGSAFDPAKSGKPILWASGNLVYYTDQGDLSPLLTQSAANSFVADAFARWSSVPTAAVSATQGGSLAEDVNGSNVTAGLNGLSLPADIQPNATNRPIAVVYDFDGQVTDHLLGTGASDPSLCATNSVLGGVDNFSTDAHIVHALVIINGRCALTNADLAPLKYRLIRTLGRVMGVGWSQANDNVQTGSPSPTNSERAGFPLMHPLEPFCAGLITTCLTNADQLRADDRAAISRFYPVTAENSAAFPGKQIFAGVTARIHGSIYFPDAHGNPGQPMQGVNVVARLIDPDTGAPSKSAVVTSVSGFLFCGNAGNLVTGMGTPQRFDAFGGSDVSLEGFFDLAGLEIPAGHSSASFQLTLENVSALYKDAFTVGPYSSGAASLSGTKPIIVIADLTAGADVLQNIVISDAATSRVTDGVTQVRRSMPPNGDWFGTLTGYGRAEFYRFTARLNRSFDLRVVALDDALHPAARKAQPELGLWTPADPVAGLPSSHADAFNGTSTGVTELTGTLSSSGTYQLAIADYRGDGRPDFRYHAHFLYADTVTPRRIGGAGSVLQIKGFGFRLGNTVTVGGNTATLLSLKENSIYLQAPSGGDGAKTIVVTDPVTGAHSIMTNAVSYGSLTTDLISVSGANGVTAAGTTAANPVRVRVTEDDGVTAVPGVSVTLSVTPSASQINTCGANTCTLTTDANGEIIAYVTVNSSGTNTVTATLASGRQAPTTISCTSAQTLTAIVPVRRIVSGNATTQGLRVRLLQNLSGVAGQTINYTITQGAGSLGAASAVTDASGAASVNLNIGSVTATTTVVACSLAGNCAQFTMQPILQSDIQLQKVSGDGQMVQAAQSPQALVLRVTDSSNPPNALPNVPVNISGSVFAIAQQDCTLDGVCHQAMAHPIANFSATVTTDANGLAIFTPTLQAAWGAVQTNAIATAGTTAAQNFSLTVFAP